MRRSFFFVFAVRLLAVVGLVAVGCLAVPRGEWLLDAVIVAAGTLLGAFWIAETVRRGLVPLERVVEGAAETKDVPAAGAASAGQAALSAAAGAGVFGQVDAIAAAMRGALARADRALEGSVGARQELEAMLDSMQDPVVAVDAAGRIQWTNQRMQRLVPGETFSTAVRLGHALVQTIRDPEVLECVRVALTERQVCERRSTTLLPGRIFEVSAAPMPGGGAVAVLHDITRLEQMERTQRDFVANVSHELRTPLTSITGYVETLLDHEASLSGQAREFLSTILKNATRMNRLTEELLVMARVEAAEQTLHPVPVRADALVRDAVQAMSGLVLEEEAVLELGAMTETQVFADADATLQVLSNLIENAVKYGRGRKERHCRVVVSAREVTEPYEAVEFSVRDFGPGIASEHLSRIFERFYRVDKARSQETGGTGLGLAIAQHMVEAQGGWIRAESELNNGSNFLFTLPRGTVSRAVAET